MSNFQCPQCGMVNIDCGKDGYKTPKELQYEKALEEIEEYINNQGIDNKWNMRIQKFRSGILDIINKADFGKSERSETRPCESCVEPVEPQIIQEAKGERNGINNNCK